MDIMTTINDIAGARISDPPALCFVCGEHVMSRRVDPVEGSTRIWSASSTRNAGAARHRDHASSMTTAELCVVCHQRDAVELRLCPSCLRDAHHTDGPLW